MPFVSDTFFPLGITPQCLQNRHCIWGASISGGLDFAHIRCPPRTHDYSRSINQFPTESKSEMRGTRLLIGFAALLLSAGHAQVES